MSQSLFVSFHSAIIPATANMFGNEQFRMMRDDAFLINCARGGLIDEDALYEALANNIISGAAVDVFVDEPPQNQKLVDGKIIKYNRETLQFDKSPKIDGFVIWTRRTYPTTNDLLEQTGNYEETCNIGNIHCCWGNSFRVR